MRGLPSHFKKKKSFYLPTDTRNELQSKFYNNLNFLFKMLFVCLQLPITPKKSNKRGGLSWVVNLSAEATLRNAIIETFRCSHLHLCTMKTLNHENAKSLMKKNEYNITRKNKNAKHTHKCTQNNFFDWQRKLSHSTFYESTFVLLQNVWWHNQINISNQHENCFNRDIFQRSSTWWAQNRN